MNHKSWLGGKVLVTPLPQASALAGPTLAVAGPTLADAGPRPGTVAPMAAPPRVPAHRPHPALRSQHVYTTYTPPQAHVPSSLRPRRRRPSPPQQTRAEADPQRLNRPFIILYLIAPSVLHPPRGSMV